MPVWLQPFVFFAAIIGALLLIAVKLAFLVAGGIVIFGAVLALITLLPYSIDGYLESPVEDCPAPIRDFPEWCEKVVSKLYFWKNWWRPLKILFHILIFDPIYFTALFWLTYGLVAVLWAVGLHLDNWIGYPMDVH